MKLTNIVMLLFLINLSAAFINATGVIVGYNVNPVIPFITQPQEELKNEAYFQSSGQQDQDSFGFGDFVKGFTIFMATLGTGVVMPGYMITQFFPDLPGLYSVYLSAPIWFLYGLALAQFIANRGLESMQ